MKYQLYIVGAGGFGREVYGLTLAASALEQEWEFAGFLDADKDALSKFNYPFGIVGDPATYSPLIHDRFVCAIGDPRVKMKICAHLTKQGAQFITLMHPSAMVGPNCSVGEGCILCAGSALTADVTVGNHVIINAYSGAGHDAVIGDGCTLSSHVDITGGVQLGKGVFLGSHSCILPKMKIGDFTKIGAGSVVIRHVPAHSVVFGVPAKNVYPVA